MDPNDSKFPHSSRVIPLSGGHQASPALLPFKSYGAGPGYRFLTDGTFQRRSDTPVRSRARIHDLGNGQIEAIVQPVYDWHEIDPLGPEALADAVHCFQNRPLPTPLEVEEANEKNEERSCRRARTKVRRLAKWKRLDTMLTLTYQAEQNDRGVAQKHLAAFLRRVKRVIPGFEYIAVPEQQKRGAWHWHIAVRKLYAGYWVSGTYVHSWKLLRSIWRSVIQGGGNIDVQASGKPGRSVRKLSSYLTKYITKGFASGVRHQNRYQASGCDLPDAVVLDIPLVGLDAVVDVYRVLLPEWSGGWQYTSPPLDSGGYYLCITPNG